MMLPHHAHVDKLKLFHLKDGGFNHQRDSKSQAATVGSLRIRVVMESISAFIGSIVDSSNPRMAFDEVSNKIAEVFELEPSAKHVSHLKDGLAI